MFEFKLQLGCLILVLYFTATYVKDTFDKKVSCSFWFDSLLVVVPWSIIFDGATAWTVNHLEVVPEWVNLLLHGLFFVSMDCVTILIFLYMMKQTIGIDNIKILVGCLIPGIVSLLVILLFLNELEYVHGKMTNYSMGISVVVCYATVFIYFSFIFIIICIKHATLEKKKMFSIITFMAIVLGILIAQIVYPEILLSSLVPAITLIGIYLNFEDPSLRRLRLYNEDMVTAFATLVENRDNSTGGHIIRTRGYVSIILQELRKHPKYTRKLSKDYIKHVLDAAPMHDIGKIATPDYILQKPGRLTEDEYTIMKEHAAKGGEIIRETFDDLDDSEYQQIAYEVARYHHEKWNGKGYPDGLKGEEIPLHARIMAIADVFDAVSAKRCYRDAMPIETCFSIIEEGAGEDFDPVLVSMFMDAKEEVLKYYENDKK